MNTIYNNDEIERAAEEIVHAVVGTTALADLLQSMLDQEQQPGLLRSAGAPVLARLDPLHESVTQHLASLQDDERQRIAELFPPTIYRRDPALALIGAAVQRAYFALPRSLYDVRPNPASRVFTALPDLVDRVDERGLLRIDGVNVRAGSQAVFVDDKALSYHQLLRRGFSANVNDQLMRTLLNGLQSGEIADLFVAIDDRRLRDAADQQLWLERDYWSGPPLTELRIDDLAGDFPQITVHARPVGADVAPWDPYDRFAGRWSLGPESGEKTFEAEELVDPATVAGDELVLVRFVHAIRITGARVFRHVDGAVRAYTPEGYARRREVQFATASHGLAEHYRKVFRVDGSIGTGLWSDIVACWFRGNELALEYLGGLAPTASSDQ